MKLGEDYKTGVPITSGGDVAITMSRDILADIAKNENGDYIEKIKECAEKRVKKALQFAEHVGKNTQTLAQNNIATTSLQEIG